MPLKSRKLTTSTVIPILILKAQTLAANPSGIKKNDPDFAFTLKKTRQRTNGVRQCCRFHLSYFRVLKSISTVRVDFYSRIIVQIILPFVVNWNRRLNQPHST